MARRRKVDEEGIIDVEWVRQTEAGEPVWHRRNDEPAKAYGHFRAYCKLGVGRSLMRLAFQLGCSQQNVQKMSSKFAWQERARAYDGHITDMEHEAKAQVRADETAKWERRRFESAEANWRRAQLAAGKADEMMSVELTELVVDSDGKPVLDAEGRAVRRPKGKWSLTAAAALLKLAAELEAAALGEALGGETDDFDPTKATPEECRAYLRREGLLDADGEIKALPAPSR